MIQNIDNQWIKVGTTYYEKFYDDEFHVDRLIPMDRASAKQKVGDKFDNIPNYPMFTNKPSHFNFEQVSNGKYNQYHKINFNPVEGGFFYTNKLLKHIFGEQYEYGMDYIQLLLNNPEQKLPILTLVSKENTTGKTTFLNWLKMIFAANSIIIGNHEFTSNFNGVYASKLLIMVDEALMNENDRGNNKVYLQRLKKMVTDKTVMVNIKGIPVFEMPFHGHFIMTSNSETNFMHIEQQDERFWVRKINAIEDKDPFILEKLKLELNNFIYFMLHREMHIKTMQDRLWFNIDDLNTDALNKFKENNLSEIYVTINDEIQTLFLNETSLQEIHFTPSRLKSTFFADNNKVSIKWIRNTLLDDFDMIPKKVAKVTLFGDNGYNTIKQHKTVFTFKRSDFNLTINNQ